MSTPEPAAPYRTLPAAHLADPTAPLRWLLADLFLAGAAGILGGAPKTGKSFFALELAVAVASGTPAAGRFPVAAPGHHRDPLAHEGRSSTFLRTRSQKGSEPSGWTRRCRPASRRWMPPAGTFSRA